MSTQRYISTSFWDDDWIQSLDPSEKLLYLYLMTNPLTNIAGVYKIANRRISFDTGFNTDTVKMILDKFEKAGKVYRMDEYVVIPSWPKHQKWEKAPKIKQGIIISLMEIGEEYLKRLVAMNYRFDLRIVLDKLSIPYDRVFPVDQNGKYPFNYSDPDLDPDIDSDLDKIPSGSGEPPPPSESQKQAFELSQLLLTSHRKGFPDFLSGKSEKEIKKTLDGWAKDIELLIRKDKKEPEKIRQVILYVKDINNVSASGFSWFQNIMSGAKLRKQFDRLYAEIQIKANKQPKAKPSPHKIASDNVAPENVEQYFK